MEVAAENRAKIKANIYVKRHEEEARILDDSPVWALKFPAPGRPWHEDEG